MMHGLGENDYIFNYLKINNEQKYKLAEEYYKYPAITGTWPTFRPNDYKALERLVRELYRLLDDDSLEPEIINPILSRFELLDIR